MPSASQVYRVDEEGRKGSQSREDEENSSEFSLFPVLEDIEKEIEDYGNGNTATGNEVRLEEVDANNRSYCVWAEQQKFIFELKHSFAEQFVLFVLFLSKKLMSTYLCSVREGRFLSFSSSSSPSFFSSSASS